MSAKATFFLIGRYVKQRPDIARAIQAAGHAIGNHTYTHPNLILVSESKLKQELSDCRKALEDAIGAPVTLFRPPFGGRRPNVLRTVRAMGMEPVLWSVTPLTGERDRSEYIVNKVIKQLSGRDKQSEIVLLHDGGHLGFGAERGFTVEATKVTAHQICGQAICGYSRLTDSIAASVINPAMAKSGTQTLIAVIRLKGREPPKSRLQSKHH